MRKLSKKNQSQVVCDVMKDMCTVAKQHKLKEKSILQISNDISEDMCTADRFQLIQVVEYWRDQLDHKQRDFIRLRDCILEANVKHALTLKEVSDELRRTE